MKRKLIELGCAIALVTGLVGCRTYNDTVIEEYTNKELTKKTTIHSSQSMIKTIIESTQNKTVIAYRKGWAGGVEATIFSEENPLPVIRAFAAKDDEAVITVPKDQKDIEKLAPVMIAITASEAIQISKDGIGSSGITASGTAIASPVVSTTSESTTTTETK